MFYNNRFVGNLGEMMDGNFREAKTLAELESLIEALTRHTRVCHTMKAPEIIKEASQKRLEEVVHYYIQMGGKV